jgi:hypothetical protein
MSERSKLLTMKRVVITLALLLLIVASVPVYRMHVCSVDRKAIVSVAASMHDNAIESASSDQLTNLVQLVGSQDAAMQAKLRDDQKSLNHLRKMQADLNEQIMQDAMKTMLNDCGEKSFRDAVKDAQAVLISGVADD